VSKFKDWRSIFVEGHGGVGVGVDGECSNRACLGHFGSWVTHAGTLILDCLILLAHAILMSNIPRLHLTKIIRTILSTVPQYVLRWLSVRLLLLDLHLVSQVGLVLCTVPKG